MVLRHADVPWGVRHFSISALPSTVGNIRESMRSSLVQHFLEFTDFFPYFSCFQHEGQWKISIKDPPPPQPTYPRVLYPNFPLPFMLKT